MKATESGLSSFALIQAYVKTILLKDAEDELERYVTVDVWENLEVHSPFKHRFDHEYSEIDRRCEALTESERLVGIFDEFA